MPGLAARTIAQRIAAAERRLAQLERALDAPERTAYRRVQQDGVDVPQREIINFIAATITDNPENGSTDIA